MADSRLMRWLVPVLVVCVAAVMTGMVGGWRATSADQAHTAPTGLKQVRLLEELARAHMSGAEPPIIEEAVKGWDREQLARWLTAARVVEPSPEMRQAFLGLQSTLELPRTSLALGPVVICMAKRWPFLLSGVLALFAVGAFIMPKSWLAAVLTASPAAGAESGRADAAAIPQEPPGIAVAGTEAGSAQVREGSSPNDNDSAVAAAVASAPPGIAGEEVPASAEGVGEAGSAAAEGATEEGAPDEIEGLVGDESQEEVEGILAEIFMADDEELLDLEILTRGLEDVDIEQLARQAAGVLKAFKGGGSLIRKGLNNRRRDTRVR